MKMWTELGLLSLGCQGELPSVPAGRKELPPLVEGGDPRGEHGVVFFKETQSTRSAGDVVSSQPLLQQVPGDGEAGARPSQAVDVPAQGGSRLPLVLLLHVVVVPIVPLPEGSPGQAGVRLRAVVVAGVRGGDGGLVNHSWGLALARQWTGRLVLAVATLVDSRGRSALGNHLCIVFCQDLRHIRHRFVTHFYCVRVKGD